MRYAIPSRGRDDVLVAKTLPLLRRLEVPAHETTVFVAQPEYATYRATMNDAGFGGVLLNAGAEGMAAQRRAIHAHYPLDERVVTLDDDLRDLVTAAGANGRPSALRPVEPDEWAGIVETGFEMCETVGARLWGLYPVPNAYFMKLRVRTALTYIGGGLWGFVNRNDDGAFDVELEDKEDFERSIRLYVADGAVVRFEYVSWRTEGYRGKGGMQADGLRTDERIRASAEALVARYPGLATLNLSKKSGKAEVRLRDRRSAAQGTLA